MELSVKEILADGDVTKKNVSDDEEELIFDPYNPSRSLRVYKRLSPSQKSSIVNFVPLTLR